MITGGRGDEKFAPYTFGGGVYSSYRGAVNVFSGAIVGNAAESGGGFCVGGGTSLNLYGGVVCGNVASTGGGLYANAATVSIDGGDIVKNFAASAGGVTALGSDMTLVAGRINDNVAGTFGGGVSIASISGEETGHFDLVQLVIVRLNLERGYDRILVGDDDGFVDVLRRVTHIDKESHTQ